MLFVNKKNITLCLACIIFFFFSHFIILNLMSTQINHTIFFLSSTFMENLIVKSWKVYYIFSNMYIFDFTYYLVQLNYKILLDLHNIYCIKNTIPVFY